MDAAGVDTVLETLTVPGVYSPVGSYQVAADTDNLTLTIGSQGVAHTYDFTGQPPILQPGEEYRVGLLIGFELDINDFAKTSEFEPIVLIT